jgi:hypothetical protein
MEHDLRLTVFWVIHLLMLGLFVIEIAFLIEQWYDDPKVADRQLASVPEAQPYARPTRQ